MTASLRRALRTHASTPFITASAVLCLATTIGAATAVFTVVNGVVLTALPFRHAPRLVAIWGVNPRRDTVRRGFSWPDARDLAQSTPSLDGLAAMSNAPNGMTLTGVGEPVQVPARIVSGGFFDVLGVSASIGRLLTTDDDRPGSTGSVVLSDAIWRQRFGADPAVAGRRLTLDGRPFVVAGVAPRSFAYPPDAQLWVTVAHGAPEANDERNVLWLELIGRMKPGVLPDGVRGDLAAALDGLTRRYHPSSERIELSIVPLQRELLGDTRTALLALLGGVLVLLAVGCANVGGLLLVRGAAKGRDVAVRLALGASRTDVVRTALVEGVVLAAASAALGAGLSVVLVRLGLSAAPIDLTRIGKLTVDARVLAFAIAVTATATIVCAVVPAIQSSTANVLTLLQQGGRSLAADRAGLRRTLAAAEMALSVVLIVAAALIGRTFLRLRAIDVGYRAEQVLAFDVPQPSSRYPRGEDSRRFARQLLPRLSALPGARHAAAVLLRPMWGVVGMDWPITVEGQSPADALQNPLVNLEAISSGYFDTLGIRLIDGRDFDDRDREGNPAVAIVSQGFARRFWDAGQPLGRRIRFPLPGSPYHRQWFTIVGIVGDAKYRELQGSRLDLYLSSNQYPDPFHQFVVRAEGDPALLVNAIRAEVRAIDADLPVDDAVVLRDAVEQQVASPRFTAMIFAAFALTATALAALGLGTLIAWQVRQRTREIGIRVALGAQPAAVVRNVLGDAAFIVAAGVAAGLATAAAATTLLQSLLYEVGPHDPWSMAGAAVVAAVAGLGSAYLPARRATRVDPMVALREE